MKPKSKSLLSTQVKVQNDKALKFDLGKPSMSLLPTESLLGVAEVLDYGAQKYNKHNWRKGMQWSRLMDATLRHLFAWNNGEQNDNESNISHLKHAACNIMFLITYEANNLGTDDRHHNDIKKENK